jgi:hypothetical protein
MIENNYAFGADLAADEFGSLAAEPLVDRGMVVPLLKRRAKIPQRKPLAIRRKEGCTIPPVVNRHFARVIAGWAGLNTVRRLVEIDLRLHAGVARIVEDRPHRSATCHRI